MNSATPNMITVTNPVKAAVAVYIAIGINMDGIKEVLGICGEQTALAKLDNFNKKRSGKYPKEVRTLIYTTNTIEGFNRQLRKVTKNKGVSPTDERLLKMLYLAMIDITK